MISETILWMTVQNGAKRIPIGLLLVVAMILPHPNAAATTPVVLGTANNYGVLAGSTITSTGNTLIEGGTSLGASIGVAPGTAITGFPPGVVNAPGTIQSATTAATLAQQNLITAYNTAAGELPVTTLTGQNLGGLTLTPGTYFFATTAQLTGTLTLNDEGNPDAQFVFQIGSTLTTASDSFVRTINAGANPSPGLSVFWQVGQSATLGTTTTFEGNILAYASITDDGNSTVYGRLLAETAAVTLNDTLVDAPPAEVIAQGGGGSGVPDTGSTLLLLGSGLVVLSVFGRRFSFLA
jgi:hypothetical protein